MGDRFAGGLGKNPWNDSVDDAGETGSDQPGADCNGADAVPSPAHPERTRMFQEHAAGQAWPLLIRLLRCHHFGPHQLA